MDLTPDEVQQGLQALYDRDRASCGNAQVTDVILLGSGFETEVFAFTLHAAEEARALVLRVYAGEGCSEKAAREFAAMSRLREAGYPVPQVLILHQDSLPFGRPFLIMERIHGKALESFYWAASEERKPDLQAKLYGLMAQLHALDGRDILPDSLLANARDPYDCIDHEIATLHELLQRLEGRKPPSLRTALAWLTSRRATVPCERLVVVHGDFYRNNVLLCADGAPFVIDWSNVCLADCRSDLAWTRLITRLIIYGDDLPDESEAELRLYAQAAGKQVAEIVYFEAVACTRLLLSVLISLQFGATRQGMRPEAEAYIRKDRDPMRRVAALLQARTDIRMPDLEDSLAALLG